MSEFREARERLDRLLRIGLGIDEEIDRAAQDVIDASRARAAASGAALGTGPVTAFAGDAFGRYVERAWRKARNETAKQHARAMLDDAEKHAVVTKAEAAELRTRLGM